MKVFNKGLSQAVLNIFTYIERHNKDVPFVFENSNLTVNSDEFPEPNFSFEFTTEDNETYVFLFIDGFTTYSLSYKKANTVTTTQTHNHSLTHLVDFGAMFEEGYTLDLQFLDDSFMQKLAIITNDIEQQLYILETTTEA